MHVAIPLYPRFTALDAVGPYTVFAFAPGWTVTFLAATVGPVADDRGTLSLTATATFAEVPRPDIVLVPGGPGTAEALTDTALLGWIAGAHTSAQWTTSVCSGAYLLGAAGVLRGRRATTHWGWLGGLRGVGAEPVAERVVVDGTVVTSAGVAAGIDMALTVLGRVAGERAAQVVQLAIEYDPQPPFGVCSPHSAPAGLLAEARALVR